VEHTEGSRRPGRAGIGAAALVPLALAAFATGPVAGVGASVRADTSASSGIEALTGVPTDNFWLASAQGAVWNFGDAGAYGSAAGLTLTGPIVAITPTTDAKGYWLVASDGGFFSFGDAAF
jgi:hypothetical protein